MARAKVFLQHGPRSPWIVLSGDALAACLARRLRLQRSKPCPRVPNLQNPNL